MPDEMEQNQQPDDADNNAAQSHDVDTPGMPTCACGKSADCTPDERSESDSIITADPGTRSLSEALATSFLLLKLAMLAVVLFFILDCVTYVDQGNVAVKKRFGAFVTDADNNIELYEAGHMVFRLPHPLEELVTVRIDHDPLVVDTTFWPSAPIQRRGEETSDLEPKDSFNPSQDGYNITGDLNMVHTRWEINYRVAVDDPAPYVLAVADTMGPDVKLDILAGTKTVGAVSSDNQLSPRDILKATALSIINRHLAGIAADDFIRTEKAGQIVESIRKELASEIENGPLGNLGIEILKVNNLRKEVPGMVRPAFDEVTSALNDRQTKIQDADAERRKILQQAHSSAQEVVNAASVYKQRVVARASADAEYLTNLMLAPPLIESKDIKDWNALVRNLANPSTPASRRIVERLPREGKQVLQSTGNNTPSEEQKKIILGALQQLQTVEQLLDPESTPVKDLPPDAARLLRRDTNLRADGVRDGIFSREDQMLNRLLLQTVFSDAISPIPSIWTDTESLRIFLAQDRFRRAREVLSETTVNLIQPGTSSVLITAPRPPNPLEADK